MKKILYLLCCLLLLLNTAHVACAAKKGVVEIRVFDSQTKAPLAARMHLKDQQGKAVKPPKSIYWHDHFVFDGSIKLELNPGNYTFEMECGPEYKIRTGYFFIENDANAVKENSMERFWDMSKEGWYSGDIDIQRPLADMPLLMRADDLHIAGVTTWSNKLKSEMSSQPVEKVEDTRYFSPLVGRDERQGGGLLLFGLNHSLSLPESGEYPANASWFHDIKKLNNTYLLARKANAWDLPVWLATGQLDGIALAHCDLHRAGNATKDIGGKPRENLRYPQPHGTGRWSQAIYFHVLNAGLRIPPCAGSGSGDAPNPVGYNRMYVHCGQEFSWQNWWENFRRGRVVITNGALLQPRVNGELPGHVFNAEAGTELELSISLNMATREPVDYFEVIKNGEVVHEVALRDWAEKNGVLPAVKFKESGWMLVRAVTNNKTAFRFACSAPFYVEVGYRPRISKGSVQFFADWVLERAKQIKLENTAEREEVIEYHRQARDFWNALLEKANAE